MMPPGSRSWLRMRQAMEHSSSLRLEETRFRHREATDRYRRLLGERPARAELARQVLNTLTRGQSVSTHDALQLRNWAVSPEDAMLRLEEIAHRILSQEETPNSKAHGSCDLQI